MPEDKELGITIGVDTKYDPAGVDAATADMEKVYRDQQAKAEAAKATAEAEQAQAEAAKASADAATAQAQAAREAAEAERAKVEAVTAAEEAEERRAAAAARAAAERDRAAKQAAAEQQREDELRYAMELETKSVEELSAELLKLAEAQKAAAEAGDGAQYEKVARQMSIARTQMGRTLQQQNVQKLAFVGQAQAAQQLGAQLQGLSASLRGGSTDFAGMTTSILSMGAALKTIPGPIGAIMLALSVAQAAWDWYQEEEKKAAEEAKKAAEEARKQAEAMRELAMAVRQGDLESTTKKWQDGFKDAFTAAEDSLRRSNALIKANAAAQAAADETQKAGLEAAKRGEMAMLAIAKQREEMTASEYERRKQLIEDRYRDEIQGIERAAEKRKVEDAEAAVNAAEQTAAAMQAELAKWEPFEALRLPSPKEWETLEKKLQLLDEDDPQYAQLQAEKNNIIRQFQEVRRLLAAAGVTFNGGNHELLEYAEKAKDLAKEGRETLKHQREATDATRTEANLARQNAANAERQRNAGNDAAAAERELARATAAAADIQKQTNRSLQLLQEATKTTGSYAPEERRAKYAILQADKALLQQRITELEKLRDMPGQDPDTRLQIEKSLRDTRRELQGLADAERANAKEARQRLKDGSAQEYRAKHKQAQSRLDAMTRHYGDLLKQAETASKMGAWGRLDGIRKNLTATAATIGRLSGQSNTASDMLKRDLDAIDACTAADKEAKDSKKKTASESAKQANAATETTTAMNATADAANEQARNVTQNQPAQQVQDAASATATMQGEIANMQSALAAFSQQQQGILTAVQNLTTAVQNLTAAVQDVATAADSAASAANATAKAAAGYRRSVNTAVSNIWSAINDLRNGI